MPSLETDALFELICAKRQCLVQVRDLGRRQGELIEAGNMTALLDLLAIKQQALLRLQEIEQALGPFREQDADTRRWANDEARQACADELARCEKLLEEIVDREKGCEGALKRRRDEAAQRLQGLHAADAARGAYVAESAVAFSQIDLLSNA